jgi:hypothetical protein
MRHETRRYRLTEPKYGVAYISYRDTYPIPIKEVCEPYGVTYITLEEAKAVIVSKYIYIDRWWDEYSLNQIYRPILASDGMFCIDKDSKLSKPRKPREPKTYELQPGKELTLDALLQPIYCGSIIYYSYIRNKSIRHDFLQVINKTDGGCQLVCKMWDNSSKSFIHERRISNSWDSIIVDPAVFAKRFSLTVMPAEFKKKD